MTGDPTPEEQHETEIDEASFGSFDGVVSISAIVFGLLADHAPSTTIALAGVAGAVGAFVSMTGGRFVSARGTLAYRTKIAFSNGAGALIGGAAPGVPFYLLDRTAALAVGATICAAITTTIGHLKHNGPAGYAQTYTIAAAAIGLTLLVVAQLPAAATG